MGHQMCDVANGYVMGMTFTSFSWNSASKTPTTIAITLALTTIIIQKNT